MKKKMKLIALKAFYDGVQDKSELKHWLKINCGTECVLNSVWNELCGLFHKREKLIKNCIYS